MPSVRVWMCTSRRWWPRCCSALPLARGASKRAPLPPPLARCGTWWPGWASRASPTWPWSRPGYASPNVTKTVLDWEYTREILHRDLRTYLTDPLQTASARLVSSREGACSQDPGAPHDQDVPSQPQASGGDGHV